MPLSLVTRAVRPGLSKSNAPINLNPVGGVRAKGRDLIKSKHFSQFSEGGEHLLYRGSAN